MSRSSVLFLAVLAGCFVPPRDQVAFPTDPLVVPTITGVDGDGTERAVSGDLPEGGLPADHRLSEALVLTGTALALATEAQLRHPEPEPDTPCLDGPGADPCVLHDASTGLLLQPGEPTQRRLTLPAAMAAGPYLLALLTPSGEAHAQVFVLQGEAGVHCWDRNENHVCDLATEDVTGDGACTSADCLPAELQCAGEDCILNRNLLVAGDVTATDTVTAQELELAEAPLSTWIAETDARLAALEADTATADALAALETRVSVVELDYATATDLAALDVRVAGVEADYATDTDLQALAASTTPEVQGSTVWTIPGDFATIDDAVAELANWRIAPGAFLTLEVTGTQTTSALLNLQHSDGHRLQLVGGSMTAGTDVIEFVGSGGVYVARTGLRLLDNLVLRGDSSANTSGVLVVEGGNATLGPDLVIEDFEYGLQAIGGAHINAAGVTVTGIINSCISATQGSMINAQAATVDGCGVGLQALEGSSLIAFGSTVADATSYGAFAQTESSVDVTGSVLTSQNHCLFAHYSSSIRATGTECVVATPTGDSSARAAFAQHDSWILAGGPGLLEAEDGQVLYASLGSSILAWDNRTLRGNGPQIAVSNTHSIVNANTATLEGSYGYGVLALGNAFASWQSVVDNGVANVAQSDSVIEE
jgi:hypothetical protein